MLRDLGWTFLVLILALAATAAIVFATTSASAAIAPRISVANTLPASCAGRPLVQLRADHEQRLRELFADQPKTGAFSTTQTVGNARITYLVERWSLRVCVIRAPRP